MAACRTKGIWATSNIRPDIHFHESQLRGDLVRLGDGWIQCPNGPENSVFWISKLSRRDDNDNRCQERKGAYLLPDTTVSFAIDISLPFCSARPSLSCIHRRWFDPAARESSLPREPHGLC